LTQERLGLRGTRPESLGGRLTAGKFLANKVGPGRVDLVLHGPLVHELGFLQHLLGQRYGVCPGRTDRVG
jgi:hypothetical protein